MRPIAATLASAGLLLVLVACSDDEPSPTPERGQGDTGSDTGSTVAADDDEPAGSVVSEDCVAGSGRVVRQLPDVLVPAVEIPAVVGADGETLAEAVTVPRQLVDAGCVVRFDAPGGCLGAVRISAVTIPEATIPALEIDGRVYPAATAPAATMAAVESPQVCRVERDGKLAGVTREGAVRAGFSRDGVARPGDDLVPTVRLEPVRVPDVDIDPERLASRELPGGSGVGVLRGRERTAYVAPASVLFDTDEAVIRPDAAAALNAIARRIAATAPGRRIVVEGHTDDRGDEAYGQQLSERRARAVADWLVRSAGFDRDLIGTKGFGETAPVVPNTSDANRQLNRRVVIVVGRR